MTQSSIKRCLAAGLPLLLLLFAAGCRPVGVEAGYLAAWSPDGASCALIPYDSEDEEKSESEIWILDAAANRAERILGLAEGLHCLQPRWSPDGSRIVFAMADEGELEEDQPGSFFPNGIRFSLWIIDRQGENLRKLMESRAPGDLFEEGRLIAWGPSPHSILYPAAAEGKVTGMILDIETGEASPFLPEPADAYFLSVSPGGERIVSLLYDAGRESADIYLQDFAAGKWNFLGSVPSDEDAFSSSPGLAFWSPDGGKCAILGSRKDETGAKTSEVRIYDTRGGLFTTAVFGEPDSALLWNESGSAFVFSEESTKKEGDAPVCRIDAGTGTLQRLVPKGENHVLSRRRDIVYFLRTYREATGSCDERFSHRLFSVRSDGSGLREIGRVLPDGSWGWKGSEDGRYMLLLTESRSAQVLDLRTGEIKPPLFFDR